MTVLNTLLIQPSYKSCVQTLFSIYNTEEGIGFKPPLGLLYIASAIKKLTNHHVDILDCQLENITHENILDNIPNNYDVIGISAWTDFWYQAYMIGRVLKKKFPAIYIVIGGPHINIFPQEVLEMDFVDAVVMGDGEIPMVTLLNVLAEKETKANPVPGLYFANIKYTDFSPYVCNDLDILPFPDRTSLPLHRYSAIISPNKYSTTMVTSRGCPFFCVYCKLKFQKPVRRSATNVLAEIEEITKLGIKEIEIYDDTFNWDHQRTIDICKGLVANNIDIAWSIRDRVDRVSEEVLVHLKKAGCYRIHLGVETGSMKIMQAIKKQITIEQARNAVFLAKKCGFVTLSYFMYGLPGETMEDAQQTLDLALELGTDYAEFSIMIPYPGTEAYISALKKGIIPYDYWLEFTKNPTPNYEIPYVIENIISREELLKLRDLSLKKFYLNYKYIFKELFKIRSLYEFIRKAKTGIGLVKILMGKFVR